MTVSAVYHARHPRGQARPSLRNVSSVREEVSRAAGPLMSRRPWEPGGRQPTPRPGRRLPSGWTQGFLSLVSSGVGPKGETRAEGETEQGEKGRDGSTPPWDTVDWAAPPPAQEMGRLSSALLGLLGSWCGLWGQKIGRDAPQPLLSLAV